MGGWAEWGRGGYNMSNAKYPWVDKSEFNLPGYKSTQSKLYGLANSYRKPQEDSSLFRTAQVDLLKQLQDQAAGNGPSVAQMQLQRGTEDNLKQALAMAASSRGGQNVGLLQRNLNNQTVGANQQMASDAATLRAQEMMSARQQLGDFSTQARQQDLAFNQLNQQLAAQYMQMGLGWAEAQAQARMDAQDLITQRQMEWNRMDFAADEARRLRGLESKKLVQNTIFSAIGSSGGGASSDENLKFNIESVGSTGNSLYSSYGKNSGEFGVSGFSEKPGSVNFLDSIQLGSYPTKTSLSYESPKVDFGISNRLDAGKPVESPQSMVGKSSNSGKAGGGYGASIHFNNLISPDAGSIRGSRNRFQMSDDNQKKDKSGSENELKAFLDSLQAVKFDYKEPDVDGYGKRYGIIAQDAEKTPVGRQFVVDTPRGKQLDSDQGFGVVLASLSDLNKRLNKVELRKK